MSETVFVFSIIAALKFSLILSKTTMVSLREYPITASIAAKTLKLNSI